LQHPRNGRNGLLTKRDWAFLEERQLERSNVRADHAGRGTLKRGRHGGLK
jgi:hypothetical protein